MHISSSYAKILGGGGNFSHTGVSPKWVKSKRQRKKERAKVGNNNGQLRIAMPPWVAHAKLQLNLAYTKVKFLKVLPKAAILSIFVT